MKNNDLTPAEWEKIIILNVNADVICERLKSCEDKLEAIKANTRKRGL